MKPPSHQNNHGFTLIELVTVVIILGIVAVTIIPRFVQNDPFELRTAQDKIISAARHAQQLSMTRGNTANIQLQVDNTSKQVTILNSGKPAIDLPAALTYTDATISYNTLGEANAATTLTITGNNSRQVCIESTGYAHAC